VFEGTAGVARPVVGGAFAVLNALSALGSARVSDLQRDAGLPRTTVHRLLAQLEQVGAVERSSGRWRLGPVIVSLGAAAPAEPRLRSVARRPLMDLAKATGEIVVLSVEMAGEAMVIDVLPGRRPHRHQPEPGKTPRRRELVEMGFDPAKLAYLRAHEQAHRGDLRPVIDEAIVAPDVSCVAAPLLLPYGGVAAVWMMVPGSQSMPAPFIAATRRTAGRIASQLSQRM
jgi:DNA-binding IclR family transcriptional regulator